MQLTIDQLTQILPGNAYLQSWYDALIEYLPNYQIDTSQRIAAFLAQCKYESEDFTVVRENLNYSADSLMKIWHDHFPTMEIATQYANNPEMIANRAYANRMGNGDEASGDGWRYCGRGLIQLTGKYEYDKFASTIDMNINDVAAYLETFRGSCQSACFFWDSNKLNDWADEQNIEQITKIVNGGTYGLIERERNYSTILNILDNS